MARTVRLEANGPVKIDPTTWPRDAAGNLKPIFVCACGLSLKFPICDGTHKSCVAEAAGVEYCYDPAGRQLKSDSGDIQLPRP
ncbi:MAG: CDGSH iron-sulfur domain-containing protein [Planctomycetes bacterium]|nr:CDGSH iron-sulfur domain-containing protein [Planctomycetota bacterium]